jgi:hypothetical protein
VDKEQKARVPASDPRLPEWKRRLAESGSKYMTFLGELAGQGIRLTKGAKRALRRCSQGVPCARAERAHRERSLKESRRQRRLTMTAADILTTSDGADTRSFSKRLRANGPLGVLGYLLLAAYKASSRAKEYRGGIERGGSRVSFSDLSYERKDKQLAELAEFLSENPELNVRWGWGRDNNVDACHVLYVDLPEGQVSFHSRRKHKGPLYPGTWDGMRDTEARIVRFCDQLLAGESGASA